MNTKRILPSVLALSTLAFVGCNKDTAAASSTPDDVSATAEGENVAAGASNDGEASAVAVEEDGSASAVGDDGDSAEAAVTDEDDTVE